MIGLICLLIANKTFYWHTHKLDDGSIASHAHPYDKEHDSSPLKSHHHTKSAFDFFNHLYVLFLFVFFVVGYFVSEIKASFFVRSKENAYNQLLSSHPGRAPPTL